MVGLKFELNGYTFVEIHSLSFCFPAAKFTAAGGSDEGGDTTSSESDDDDNFNQKPATFPGPSAAAAAITPGMLFGNGKKCSLFL